MPCGGIRPVSDNGICWQCQKDGAKHFCEEWDTFIHGVCVPEFLLTDEGKVVIDHGHLVIIDPRYDHED
jgi:hypothetical protein